MSVMALPSATPVVRTLLLLLLRLLLPKRPSALLPEHTMLLKYQAVPDVTGQGDAADQSRAQPCGLS